MGRKKKKAKESPWEQIAYIIENNGVLDDVWWNASLIPYLSELTVESAQILYQDLCRVQLAVYDSVCPNSVSFLTDLIDR